MKILDILKTDSAKTISEHGTFLVAIPYIIGGLWQFFQLTDISMDLIKFFSLTQLLIDGLLIMAQCICLYIFTYYISIIISAVKESSERVYALLGVLILFICVGSGLTMAYQIATTGEDQIIQWSMRSFLLFFIILFSFVMSNKISIVTQIIFIFITYSLITKVFKGENKIENITHLTSKLKINHPSLELSYYNDQFLFFETNRGKEDNKIIIKKMDDIFEDSEKTK